MIRLPPRSPDLNAYAERYTSAEHVLHLHRPLTAPDGGAESARDRHRPLSTERSGKTRGALARAPAVAHKPDPEIVAALVEVRQRHPPWGAKKLLAGLPVEMPVRFCVNPPAAFE